MGYGARNGSGSGSGNEINEGRNGNRIVKERKKNRSGDGDGDGDWGLGNLCIKITGITIIGIKGGIIAIMTTTMIMTMTDYEYVGLFLNLEGVNE